MIYDESSLEAKLEAYKDGSLDAGIIIGLLLAISLPWIGLFYIAKIISGLV